MFLQLAVCMFAGLATATMWPVAVLNGAHFIDSAWDVACFRAEAGGKLLAHMLMHGLHNGRPVTLVGTSIGARLVFHCCLELYRQGEGGRHRRHDGVILHVCLHGPGCFGQHDILRAHVMLFKW
jgi:Protein of unknown function (DUF726)